MISETYNRAATKYILSFNILSLVTLLSIINVHAGEWEITPLIEIQEVYTDNVLLNPDAIKQDDFISVITPGVSMSNMGNKLQFNLDYSLQNLLYVNSGSRNEQFHLLQTTANAELLEDKAYLELNVNRSTQNLNDNGRNGLDNISVASDKQSVLNYTVRPYWNQRIGNTMDLNVAYSRDEVSASSLSDSNSNKITIDVSSGANFQKLLWDLKFDNRKINNSSAASSRTREILGKFRYLLSRKLALSAELGYDDNKYQSNRADISGELWNIGFEWNPSVRTSVKFNYGERYFGEDLGINISHRGRRSQARLSFERIPTTTRDELIDQQTFSLTDAFDNPIDQRENRQINNLDISAPQQTSDVLIKSAFNAVYSYQFKKNQLTFSASYEELNYEVTQASDLERNLTATWNSSLFSSTQSTISLSWSKDSRRNGRDDRYIIADMSLNHSINANFGLSLGYRFVDRKSNNALLAYDENRVYASINKKFH